MRLFFCPDCNTVVSVKEAKNICECGRAWGHMDFNGNRLVIGGKAVPMEIDDEVFKAAALEWGKMRKKVEWMGSIIDPKSASLVITKEPYPPEFVRSKGIDPLIYLDLVKKKNINEDAGLRKAIILEKK